MRTLNTRLLLTLAAIGVACGLLLMPFGPLHAGIITGAPFIYAAMLGLYLLPGAIAQRLLQLPGTAIIAAAFTGVVDMLNPLQTGGPRSLLYISLFGLLQELAYLVFTRFKSWPKWPAWVGAAAVSLICATAFSFLFDMSRFGIWAVIVSLVLAPVVYIVITMIAQAIADSLRRAGVASRTSRRERQRP